MNSETSVHPRNGFGFGWSLGLAAALFECVQARGAVLDDPGTRGIALLMLGAYPLVAGVVALALSLVPWVRKPRRFVVTTLFLVISPWLLGLAFPRVLNVMFLPAGRWPIAAGAILLSLLLAREAGRRAESILKAVPIRWWVLFVPCAPLVFGAISVARPAGLDRETYSAHGRPGAPNILLITIDTLRKDELQCYGGPTGNTPCLDSLATAGRSFTSATSCSPWTLASLANMMTGHYPSTTGVLTGRNRLTEQFDTLAELLRQGGYHTHAILTNIWLRPEFGLHQGFQVFNHRAPDEPSPVLHHFLGYRVFRLVKHLRRASSRVVPESAEDVVEETRRFLQNPVAKPFFLWLHFNDVHDPYHPPSRFRPAPEPDYRGPFRFTSGNMMTLRQGGRLTRADRQRIRELYRGEISYVDACVREILGALRGSGLNDSTLTVVTSDHGEEFWEHDNVMHGHTLYSELLRIPLLFAWPTMIAPGETDDRACSLVDLVPTMVDMLGLETPAGLPGRSLFHQGADDDTPQYGEALQFFREMKSVAIGNWKLVLAPDTGTRSLFNLETDPAERVNEVFRFPEIAAVLSDSLEVHLTKCLEQADRLKIRQDAATVRMTAKLREQLRAQGYIE